MTEQEKINIQINDFNKEIRELVEQRNEFMNANMHHFAAFQIGDVLVNTRTGEKGICVGHDMYYGLNLPLGCDCKIKIIDPAPSYGEIHDHTSNYIYDNIPWHKEGDVK